MEWDIENAMKFVQINVRVLVICVYIYINYIWSVNNEWYWKFIWKHKYKASRNIWCKFVHTQNKISMQEYNHARV